MLPKSGESPVDMVGYPIIITTWWFFTNPFETYYIVKLDHETPGIRVENKKYLSCHHLVIVYQGFIYIPGAAGGISEPSSSITRRMDPPSFPPQGWETEDGCEGLFGRNPYFLEGIFRSTKGIEDLERCLKQIHIIDCV